MKVKSTLSLITGGLLASSTLTFANTARTYASDFIVQEDFESGDVEYIFVDGPQAGEEKTGSVGANHLLPIGPGGAKFELFAIDLPTGQLIPEPLDTKLVGVFPKVNITLKSQDPYSEGKIRTRADEPYYARVDVSNISNKPGDPVAVKRVYVERLFAEYTSDQTLPLNNDRGFTVIDTEPFKSDIYVPSAHYLTKNGHIEGLFTTAMEEPSTKEFFKQSGEEHVRVYAQPAEGAPWEIIAEKSIQIWPAATATLTAQLPSGTALVLPDNQTINSADDIPEINEVPTFVAALSDLYPSSFTKIAIFKINEDGSDPAVMTDVLEDKEEHQNSLELDAPTPQSTTFSVPQSEWKEGKVESGTYRVIVSTKTDLVATDKDLQRKEDEAPTAVDSARVIDTVVRIDLENELQVKGSITTTE